MEFKDRKSKKFLHKNQFSGSDLVDWILSVVTKHKIDRQKAAYFAQMLIEEVLIKGTGKYENKFKDSLKTFYFINDNEKSVIVNAFDFTALSLFFLLIIFIFYLNIIFNSKFIIINFMRILLLLLFIIIILLIYILFCNKIII